MEVVGRGFPTGCCEGQLNREEGGRGKEGEEEEERRVGAAVVLEN